MIRELDELLRRMEPRLNDGIYVYASAPAPLPGAVAAVREDEGWCVVMEEHAAQQVGLEGTFRCAWITLTVHSDLAAVGLTAAVANVLAEAGIPANVVAGLHHDHLFVPVDAGERALAALRALIRPH